MGAEREGIMASKRRNPPDLTKTLPSGQRVRMTRVAGTWRLLGAAGDSLFFLAEVADTGGFPSGIVRNQLTQSQLFSRRHVDDRTYTVAAHGGSVDVDPARGYAQESA
jgi:hypothetical protein